MQIGGVEIVLTRNAHQGEQRIAPGVGQRRPHASRAAMSASGQTGQSEAIHSPEACASMVVRLTIPVVWSTAVVCIVAISCWPSVLRTMSRPLDSGA